MLKQALFPERVSIPWIVTIQVVAFVGYHLNQQFFFSLTLQRIFWDKNGIEHVVAVYGAGFWLNLPTVLFLWLAIQRRERRWMLIVCALLTLLAAYNYRYPVLTAFLHLLGQFENFSYFMMGNAPDLGAILGY